MTLLVVGRTVEQHFITAINDFMGYPAMTPKWESRKTPPEGGRKSMQGERRTQYQLVKMAS